ncbi:hypothetical protein A5888_001650 [Enterococcus sp. 9E7_DIV0242]|uniref:Uncharacterized protein n=1 Tax=Candidatus Enterococcus clewellii TaxID=1834193 RepID=A0A242K3W6_9ENTE|nr:hypothetical protein A5888_003164 [Enterococcus sp. 9E7_DIV0242]
MNKKGLAAIANKPLYKIRRLQAIGYLLFIALIISLICNLIAIVK